MRTLLIALLPLALAACASSGPSNSYATEVEQLRQTCEARGGMLTPSGRITGQAPLDNPCVIRDATNLPPSP